MVKRKTVIVVGAGASKEVDLPTGDKLKSDIAKILDIRFKHGQQISGDPIIPYALKIAVDNRDINPFIHAGWAIRDTMPQAISIDNYIDINPGDEKIELCGKLAITQAILKAERSSSIYINRLSNQDTINFQNVQETWYHRFFQILTENCRIEELPKRLLSLTFIVFNYDRCIEHYLYYALINYYRIELKQSAELVNSIKIYHPYGMVGYLPWQGRNNSIEFGDEPNSRKLLEISRQIRTFAEGTDPEQSYIEKIREEIKNCEMLIFLGFAYHRLNMAVLKPQQGGDKHIRCFGTAKNISKSDIEIIKKKYIRKLSSTIIYIIEIRDDLTCYELFEEYRRSLSIE